MSGLHLVLIALAGVGAGAINAVVGSGTLITFPTLVALGYPPVISTMSNAVGLVAGSVSGTWGYRRELSGQWDRLRWQIPASLGGAVLGAWLLLHLPEKVFIEVVPVLLIGALILVVTGPWIQAWARRRAEEAGRAADHLSTGRMVALVSGTFAVAVYGGYFTAAQGILLVGVMGALLPEVDPAHECREKPADSGGKRGRGAFLHSCCLPPDQLAGGRGDRCRLTDRWLCRGSLRASAVAAGVAGGDCCGWPHWAISATDGVSSACGVSLA